MVMGTLGKGLLSEIAKRPPLWPTALRQWRALTPTRVVVSLAAGASPDG